MTSIKNTNLYAKKILQWPRHLRTPAELIHALSHKTKLSIIRSPICSKIILQIVGSWAYLMANVFNKTQVFNIETFNQELRRLENQNETNLLKLPDSEKIKNQQHQNDAQDVSFTPKAPLITFSNHISCIDDPVLWGALLPFNYYSVKTDSVRWSAAAIDICFSKPWHSTFFSLGKTFPIIRGVGVDQPAMEFACALLKHHQWLHLFPEGKVMRDDNQQKISNLDRGYIFKWGISKLILDYFKKASNSGNPDSQLRILPLYHLGLDDILPIGWPYIPRFNKLITIFLRHSVIEMDSKLLNHILKTRTLSSSQIKSRSDDEIDRIKLTNYLEEEMEKLVEPATRLHNERINGH